MNFHASLKPDNEEEMRHVCTRMNKRRIFKQFKKPKRIIERIIERHWKMIVCLLVHRLKTIYRHSMSSLILYETTLFDTF